MILIFISNLARSSNSAPQHLPLFLSLKSQGACWAQPVLMCSINSSRLQCFIRRHIIVHICWNVFPSEKERNQMQHNCYSADFKFVTDCSFFSFFMSLGLFLQKHFSFWGFFFFISHIKRLEIKSLLVQTGDTLYPQAETSETAQRLLQSWVKNLKATSISKFCFWSMSTISSGSGFNHDAF